MSDLPSRASGQQLPAHKLTLTDRVMSRVHDAGRAATRRARTSRSKTSRPNIADRTAEQAREARSLRRVFHDLGLSYRQYRRDTGAAISPDIRDAAKRFRRERNVTSLVSVAACLDALDILTW